MALYCWLVGLSVNSRSDHRTCGDDGGTDRRGDQRDPQEVLIGHRMECTTDRTFAVADGWRVYVGGRTRDIQTIESVVISVRGWVGIEWDRYGNIVINQMVVINGNYSYSSHINCMFQWFPGTRCCGWTHYFKSHSYVGGDDSRNQ